MEEFHIGLQIPTEHMQNIFGNYDSYIRQIMYYRHIKCYSWSLIGAEMHTTPDSVRRMHDRYLKRTEAAGAER